MPTFEFSTKRRSRSKRERLQCTVGQLNENGTKEINDNICECKGNHEIPKYQMFGLGWLNSGSLMIICTLCNQTFIIIIHFLFSFSFRKSQMIHLTIIIIIANGTKKIRKKFLFLLR